MKKLVSLLIGLLCVVSAMAQNKIIFVVGSDVCSPITVRCQGRSYTVKSYLEINSTQSTTTVSATDCNGNKLRYEYKNSSGTENGRRYSISTYTFHTIKTYGSGSSSYSNSSSSSYGNSSAYNTGERIGAGMTQGLFSLGGGADGDAYPSMQLAFGASRAYGEFARLRYTGYGFHAYGSIGKDLLLDSEYKNKILWNIGIGSYFAFGGNGNPNMDVSLGMSVGQLAQFEKLSLMIDADYTYWIGRWRRVGLFAGGSIGWGSFTEVFNTDEYSSMGGFAWNLEIGLTFRLANF